MASGFLMSNGQDFDAVFGGGGNQTTGYKTSTGQDLGARYSPGNSGIVTGYKIADGRDLGAIFGRLASFVATAWYDRDRTSCKYNGVDTTTHWTCESKTAVYGRQSLSLPIGGTNVTVTQVDNGHYAIASCGGFAHDCNQDIGDNGLTATLSSTALNGRTINLYINGAYRSGVVSGNIVRFGSYTMTNGATYTFIASVV